MPKPQKRQRDALRDWESLSAALQEAGRPGPAADAEIETAIEKGDALMQVAKDSQNAIFLDWEMLLAAMEKNAGRLGDLEPYRSTLAGSLSEARTQKDLQLSARAASQEATRRLQQALAEGSHAAIRLRCFVRGVLGPRNEQLVQFGVAPIRRRGRRRKNPQQA